MDDKRIGKSLYDNYRGIRCGIAYNGDKMKDFEEMPPDLQNAWTYAGCSLLYDYGLLDIVQRIEDLKQNQIK